jgi:hypothetical protein
MPFIWFMIAIPKKLSAVYVRCVFRAPLQAVLHGSDVSPPRAAVGSLTVSSPVGSELWALGPEVDAELMLLAHGAAVGLQEMSVGLNGWNAAAADYHRQR